MSCSDKDGGPVTVSVSANSLAFPVEGGEQAVYITSGGAWDYSCDSEDWILVRRNENKLRIIAGANTAEETRLAIVQVRCEGAEPEEIAVTQQGTSLEAGASSYSVESQGEEISVPVTGNTEWAFANPNEWCTATKESGGLRIAVSRNYRMQSRTGSILIRAGDVSKEITLAQSAAPWYESFEMAAVDGGTFHMGAQKESPGSSNYDESAYYIEAPVHQVTLGSYSIGMFEVSQAQWTAAMQDNPSGIQGDNLPVENVTWEQVQEFISLLREKSGLDYRLPTEAEWEFAARGGNLSGGFRYSGYSIPGACGWYYSNSESSTHEVGSKYPNELGICDMSGNVREWCSDWFDYYSASKATNPQGAASGDMKVNRGGSWTTPAVNCRNTYRHTDFPYEPAQDLGFRIALSSE